MKLVNAFSKALLLCAGLVLASSPLLAETITQSAGVTIVRGEDDAEAAAQRRTSRGRAGVSVFRGESATAPQASALEPIAVPEGISQLVGGQNLWVHDAATNAVTACNLRYDAYGNQQVRCRSEYP
jgi:hypothetical protein